MTTQAQEFVTIDEAGEIVLFIAHQTLCSEVERQRPRPRQRRVQDDVASRSGRRRHQLDILVVATLDGIGCVRHNRAPRRVVWGQRQLDACVVRLVAVGGD